MPRQQYILRVYTNGTQEIVDTTWCIRKITYNTGDIVWMKEDKVIAIQPHDSAGRILKYADDDLFRINSVKLEKLSHEAETYLKKKEVLKNLEANPHCYDLSLRTLFKHFGVKLPEITKDIVLKFLNITPNKSK